MLRSIELHRRRGIRGALDMLVVPQLCMYDFGTCGVREALSARESDSGRMARASPIRGIVGTAAANHGHGRESGLR